MIILSYETGSVRLQDGFASGDPEDGETLDRLRNMRRGATRGRRSASYAEDKMPRRLTMEEATRLATRWGSKVQAPVDDDQV